MQTRTDTTKSTIFHLLRLVTREQMYSSHRHLVSEYILWLRLFRSLLIRGFIFPLHSLQWLFVYYILHSSTVPFFGSFEGRGLRLGPLMGPIKGRTRWPYLQELSECWSNLVSHTRSLPYLPYHDSNPASSGLLHSTSIWDREPLVLRSSDIHKPFTNYTMIHLPTGDCDDFFTFASSYSANSQRFSRVSAPRSRR